MYALRRKKKWCVYSFVKEEYISMDLFYYGGYFSEDSKKEEVLSRGVSVDYKKGYKGYSVKLDEKLRKGKKR